MAMTRNPDVRDVLNQVVNDPRYAEVMRVPVISPPQIVLAMTALGLFAGSTLAYLNGMLPLWVAMFGIWCPSTSRLPHCMTHPTARCRIVVFSTT